MIDKGGFDDAYFIQILLVDYMKEHDCASWDVVWDARGTFHEPHTRREVPIGTLEVRQYLGERSGHDKAAAFALSGDTLYPTRGPENRYDTVLFVEKGGFGPLLESAQIAERFQKLDEWRIEIAQKAADFTISNLRDLVEAELTDDPTIPWDVAVARVIGSQT
jgi:hypothetical protein